MAAPAWARCSRRRPIRIRNWARRPDSRKRRFMLEAKSLSKQTGVRHRFFTRDGGVSSGVYATLNGGTGSNDAADKIAENRARMAAALGVAPPHFVHAHQIPSPDVLVAEAPWPAQARPRADAIVTRTRKLAIGVSTADCGPLLFADAAAGV